jgi:hypothetical protein
MVKKQEEIFRKYEEAINNYYKTHPLMTYPLDEAVYACLSIVDGIILTFLPMMQKPEITVGQGGFLRGIFEGVSQAVKWLLNDMEEISVSSTSDFDLINTAGEFVKFAKDYVDVADFHKMYGRGQVNIEINISTSTVTFIRVSDTGLGPVLAFYEQMKWQNNLAQQSIASANHSKIAQFNHVFRNIDYNLIDGRISDISFPDNILSIIPGMANQHFDFELIQVDPKTDFGGFILEEYILFFKSVATWSSVAFGIYLHLAFSGTKMQNECMPVQIVNRKSFTDTITRLAHLEKDTVDNILNNLTCNRDQNPDILVKPFIANDSIVAWSPSFFLQTRPLRNMLKGMARSGGRKKRLADNIIGEREKALNLMVAQRFNEHGYQFAIGRDISSDNENTDIDILLYHTTFPEQVLLIESKAFLAVDEINEVHQATKEMQHGQEQLQKAIRILQKMPVERKNEIYKFADWDRVQSYYPVVITSDAEPNALLDPDKVPAISYNTLTNRLRTRHLKSPFLFWNTCKKRPWLSKEIKENKRVYQDIKIGAITYRIPMQAITYCDTGKTR